MTNDSRAANEATTPAADEGAETKRTPGPWKFKVVYTTEIRCGVYHHTPGAVASCHKTEKAANRAATWLRNQGTPCEVRPIDTAAR